MNNLSDQVDYNVVAEPEAQYEINRDLNLARSIVELTGENLFLTGRAGTGKTTFLRHLRETTVKRMIVLAPTGVAAINAQGTTIHSLFQFPFAPFIPGKGFIGEESNRFRFSELKRKLLRSVELLVIDEVSMVRPDILDAMDATLRRFRDRSRPFGGVQLLLIGDLRQLAPVVKEQEWTLLKEHYATPYFFQSHALNEAGYRTIELRTVYRQTDARFLSMLNEVREGRVSSATLQSLNARCRVGFEPADNEGYIRLTALNRSANEINMRKLEALQTEARTYAASIDGNFPEYSFPVDKELTLKRGAQVMFVRNDTGEQRRFFNGMIGTVVGLDKNVVKVVPSDGSEVIECDRAAWENTRYVVDESTKEIRQVVDGVFSQFPLRLAWAITIHKSQGLTFDKAVIDASSSFAAGQVYVALSRCRSLEGMVLSQPLRTSAVICDGNVNEFLEKSESMRPTIADLELMKAEYCKNCLLELFDFTAIGNELRTFARLVAEYVVPIHRELDADYRNCLTMYEVEVEKVGQTFARIYASRPISENELAANTVINEKIRNGCGYFTGKLASVTALISRTPVDLDNKGYKKRLTASLEALAMLIGVKVRVLGVIGAEGFNVRLYSKAKGDAFIELSDPKPDASSSKRKRVKKADLNRAMPKKSQSVADSSAGDDLGDAPERKCRKTKEKKPVKPKGYSIYESLGLFRNGMSIPEIASHRQLTEGTIAGHLANAVINGDLKIEDVIKPSALQVLRKEWDSKSGQYADIRDSLAGIVPDYEISLFYKCAKNK